VKVGEAEEEQLTSGVIFGPVISHAEQRALIETGCLYG
jgi:hypothetical protein